MRTIPSVLLVGLLPLVPLACSSDEATSTLANGCTLNSDCSAGLVCSLGRCHAACATSVDCTSDAKCVKTPAGAVCQLPDEETCTYATKCPNPLTCAVDGTCRAQCQGNGDCLALQVCTQGVCADGADLDDQGRLPTSGDAGAVASEAASDTGSHATNDVTEEPANDAPAETASDASTDAASDAAADVASDATPERDAVAPTTIYDIQNPAGIVAVGAAVDVRGAVVTAIDSYGQKTGALWIEEQAGGAYSGVMVFGAEIGDASALAVGDLVDVTGVKSEFVLASDTTGRTLTEIVAPAGGVVTVTRVGTGTMPAPELVDALAIGQQSTQAARDAEWEKWEGVLIQLNQVSTTTAVLGALGTNPDPTLEHFGVTGPLTVQSNLAAFGVTPNQGDCLASVTGILDYQLDWLIDPTTSSDVVQGGVACPPVESGANSCSDGVDNDANGASDCADYSCDVATASCVTHATVSEINTGGVTVGAPLDVDGVFITALSPSTKTFWVADSPTAAANGGIAASGFASFPPGFVIGAKVDVDLVRYSSPGSLNQLGPLAGGPPTLSVVAGPGAVTPLTTTTSTLASSTLVIPFVGSLVSVSNLKVTAKSGAGAAVVYTLTDNGAVSLPVGVTMVDPAAAIGTCFSKVTGIVSLDTSHVPPAILLPRTMGDFVSGSSCN